MEEAMENEVKIKNKFWHPDIKEYKRKQLENNEYISKQLKTKDRMTLYVNNQKSLDKQEKILKVFKKWCFDYCTGRTYVTPTANAIAKFCNVSAPFVRKIISPYYDKYLKYLTITKEEAIKMGIYNQEVIDITEEEFEKIWSNYNE